MAKLKLQLPDETIKQFNKLEEQSEETFGKMTKAGAEVVYKNIKSNMSSVFKGETKSQMEAGLKVTRTYKSPKKDTIGNFVGFYGYIPFSDPKRKVFRRKGGNGDYYETDKGVPREFLANLYEYGSNPKNISATRFIKKAQKKPEIEKTMQEVLDKEAESIVKGD